MKAYHKLRLCNSVIGIFVWHRIYPVEGNNKWRGELSTVVNDGSG